MTAAGYEHLFRPLAIGPVELPNRIVSTSHQTNLVRDHQPTEDFVAYHAARACGDRGTDFSVRAKTPPPAEIRLWS